MERFVISGGVPLRGTVTPSGNKNAALPILAACLLTEEPVVLHNVPLIKDVLTMRELVESLGGAVEERGAHTWCVTTRHLRSGAVDEDLATRIRASMLLAGPMLARGGSLELPVPGGDVIGRRRLDTHVQALRALGASVELSGSVFSMHADELRGASVLLDEAGVTATENAVMAAVLASGTTVIRNAACEPHVEDLCLLLNCLGARIVGIGSNVLTIEGVYRLHGGEHTIGPDFMEVVSLIGAAAMTRGEVRIAGAGRRHLETARITFGRLGVAWDDVGEDDILVRADQTMEVVPEVAGGIPEIKTGVWPGFPTDLMSVAITVATQVRGTVLLHDWMFSGRMYFTDKLERMGARIILCDPHRCLVEGPARLHGSALESPDIRAGMALVLAALTAEGESVIRNIVQIERGYENVEGKLRALGARIERRT
jgi:UDP-N-acetylglucosamine 1-carboxyvinyltransferase